MELFINILTLCISAIALIVAFISLLFTIWQKRIAQKNNDLSGLNIIDEQKEKMERFLDENIGHIKCFIFDCQSVISGLSSNFKFVKDADRKICCGFERIRMIGIANKNQSLIDISSFNVDSKSYLSEDMLFARCVCSLTHKYLSVSSSNRIGKDLAKVYKSLFEDLYQILYVNINNLIEHHENLNEQLFLKIQIINKKAEEIGL